MNTDRAEIATEIALNEERQAPSWLELIPSGPDIVGRDGRRWTLSDPERLVAAFNSQGFPVPLDFEHASRVKAPKGERADAVGWIEELDLRSGAVWGRVEWTEDGAQTVAKRQYRYVSPAFTHTRDGHIIAFKHAGLTNLPNLELTALNREDEKEPKPMALSKALAEALGLSEDASDASALTAINALKSDQQTALNRAENPDPEKFVPKADHELALNRVKVFEKAKADAHEADIIKAVDGLIEVGDPNHPPSKREDYIAMCRTEGGLERFNRLFEADLSQSLNTSQTAHKTATGKSDGSHGLSDEELSVCRQMGTDPKDFAEAKKAEDA